MRTLVWWVRKFQAHLGSLLFALVRFTQTAVVGQPCLRHVCQHRGAHSTTCSLRPCLCHIRVLLTGVPPFSFLPHLLWGSGRGELWCYQRSCSGAPQTAPMLRQRTPKYCACSVRSCNWLLPHLLPSPRASLFLETQQYWNQANY